MSLILYLAKYLRQKLQQRRAENSGTPYADSTESATLPVYNDLTADGKRIPDMTPEEEEFLRRDGLGTRPDFKNWRKYFTRKHMTPKKILNIVLILIVVILGILILAYQDTIVRWFEPAGRTIKSLPAGWLIPIAIIIVMSFPPLFGQEIVHIICGVVWGLGIGFAIVIAGTILGELLEFYTFRYCCTGRTKKWEKGSLSYALLAKITRDEGFIMVLMTRLSVLPSHYTTLLYALTGVNVFSFLAALVISLIKPFATVYLGVVAQEEADGTETKGQKTASSVIIAVTIVISIVAMRYIAHRANKAKPTFILERRLARMEASSPLGASPLPTMSYPPSPNHPSAAYVHA